jgi:hypothetical protein
MVLPAFNPELNILQSSQYFEGGVTYFIRLAFKMKICETLIKVTSTVSLLLVFSLTSVTVAQAPDDGTDVINANTTNSLLTCCYIQSACDNCRTVYKVNSVKYCCPNCMGAVLVTDLRCRCNAPTFTDQSKLNCTLTDKVVGDYFPARPSYYKAGASDVKTFRVLYVFAAVGTLLYSLIK